MEKFFVISTYENSASKVFRLEAELLISGTVIIAFSFIIMNWYRKHNSKAALWTYGIYNGLIFLWFVFIDGFLDHVMKALGLQHKTFLPGGEAAVVKTVYSLWSSETSNIFYGGIGVFTSIASFMAIYFYYRFMKTQLTNSK